MCFQLSSPLIYACFTESMATLQEQWNSLTVGLKRIYTDIITIIKDFTFSEKILNTFIIE